MALAMSIMMIASTVGCSDSKSGDLYQLGADICTMDILQLAGIPAGLPISRTGEDSSGNPSQTCIASIFIDKARGPQTFLNIYASTFAYDSDLQRAYENWSTDRLGQGADIQELPGLGEAAVFNKMPGEFHVVTRDDNLLVRVTWSDQKSDNPPDVATRLRRVARAVMVALRRPDAPPLPTESAHDPDPVITTPSVSLHYEPVENLCDIVDLTSLGTVEAIKQKAKKEDFGSYIVMSCDVRFGLAAQMIISATVSTKGGDQAQGYADARGMASEPKDITGLGTAAFIDQSRPLSPRLVAYDHNLKVDVSWRTSSTAKPTDEQLIKIARSIFNGL